MLGGAELTDLTHTFCPGIPHHPALPDEVRSNVVDFDSSYRSRVTRYELVGQWGTHVDAPRHFDPQGHGVDLIPLAEMILPLVVLDVHRQAALDPDYVATVADALAWERQNDAIPRRSFVALRTDWHRRWQDPAAFANLDSEGIAHRPGWSRELLRFLVEDRSVAAIGHETPDTDSGVSVSRSGDYELERYVLSAGLWQLEMLAHLDRVPERGALILATWPKALDGPGFPARAIAIHP